MTPKPEVEVVIGKDGDMNCPMCGAEVRVVGEGTLSYEPVVPDFLGHDNCAECQDIESLLDEAVEIIKDSDCYYAPDCDVPAEQRPDNPRLCSRCRFLARPEVKARLERGEG
jgi:hypothetical protein